jgi:hypothetical protein
MVDEGPHVFNFALNRDVFRIAVPITQAHANAIVANHEVMLRKSAEELLKGAVLPVLFDVADPPSRKDDGRPIAIEGVCEPFAIWSAAKSDTGHVGILAFMPPQHNLWPAMR